MFATIVSAQQLADGHRWWSAQSLAAAATGRALVSPEDACQAGMEAVKHAGGAADADMPSDFCACPRLYAGDQSCVCPYQYNHAIY